MDSLVLQMMTGAYRLVRRVGRVLKYGLVVGVGAGSVALLQHNEWDFSSVGVVRFGRAAMAVSTHNKNKLQLQLYHHTSIT